MPEIPDAIGGELATDEWANLIRDRTAQRYATVAARTTEHPAPVAGDLAFLEDTGDLDVYHSGAWRHVGSQVAAVQMLAGGAVPAGWLLCNGQAVSRTTYALLFAAIGETWGAGDGVATFNVPDMRGRVPRGVAATGAGDALGETFGADTHDHGIGHTHNVDPPQTAAPPPSEFPNAAEPGGDGGFSHGVGPHSHSVNILPFASANANTLDSSAESTLPAGRAIHFIIKT